MVYVYPGQAEDKAFDTIYLVVMLDNIYCSYFAYYVHRVVSVQRSTHLRIRGNRSPGTEQVAYVEERLWEDDFGDIVLPHEFQDVVCPLYDRVNVKSAVVPLHAGGQCPGKMSNDIYVL